MPQEAFDYIDTQPTCVLAVEMTDGSPHAATVHFAHVGEEPKFIFLTERRYRKFEPFGKRDTVRATVVVGTSEADNKTLQLDGTAVITENESHIVAYYNKFSTKKRENLEADNDVFLVFTPTWWRYTDWTLPEGKTIWTSDGGVTVKAKK